MAKRFAIVRDLITEPSTGYEPFWANRSILFNLVQPFEF